MATILDSTALDSSRIFCIDIFCPLCQHLTPFLCHKSIWILSPPPPPSPIYLTPRARIQHLLGFLSGLSIVTIEIWSVYQVSPHELIYIMCIHINGQTFTQVSLCWRMELWLCSFFSAWEKQKSPPHAGSLVAAGACDMDHLPPNTVTEAENSRCVLAIWI